MEELIQAVKIWNEPQRAIEDQLARVSKLLHAEHAEFSIWQTDDSGKRALERRVVHDPYGLDLPPCILPGGERTGFAAGEGQPVRTWATDLTPGWGGPVLMSAREASQTLLGLVCLRRSPSRKPFTSRQAAILDALHRWNAGAAFRIPFGQCARRARQSVYDPARWNAPLRKRYKRRTHW